MGNSDYEEFRATVRVPKGQRLADSRDSAGWLRGFTPRTTECGPRHVEIKIEDPEDKAQGADYKDYSRAPFETERAKTDDEQELEDYKRAIVILAIIAAVELGRPFLLRLLDKRIIPFYVKRKEAWDDRKNKRPKISKPRVLELDSAAPPGDAVAVHEACMTSDEARRHFSEALMAQYFANEKMRMLATARIEDMDLDPKILRSLKKLSQVEVEQALTTLLASNPGMLTDLANSSHDALGLKSLLAVQKQAARVRRSLEQ